MPIKYTPKIVKPELFDPAVCRIKFSHVYYTSAEVTPRAAQVVRPLRNIRENIALTYWDMGIDLLPEEQAVPLSALILQVRELPADPEEQAILHQANASELWHEASKLARQMCRICGMFQYGRVRRDESHAGHGFQPAAIINSHTIYANRVYYCTQCGLVPLRYVSSDYNIISCPKCGQGTELITDGHVVRNH